MQILPLHPLLAAEIRDFSHDQFEESDWTLVIESLKKYSVLVFRNQEIDNEVQIRFSERLGPLETTKVGTEGAETKLVFLSNMDSKGELLPVTSRAILNNRANQLWHSDSSFKTVPARATVLRGLKIPLNRGRLNTFPFLRFINPCLKPQRLRLPTFGGFMIIQIHVPKLIRTW